MGLQKPNHLLEMARTVWENRRNLPYAWRILSKGVCDGCALGVAGFKDWTIDGVHLCTTRLNLLQVNTARALDPERLADVAALRTLSSTELRALGRLPYPMLRMRGERGFKRISWERALQIAGSQIKAAGPSRVSFFLTARGIMNETYYAIQKVVRFLGTNDIDNAARICHAPSTGALKHAIGFGATTVSYRDVIESDLIVLFGSNVANAQPVFMKYLHLAKKRGTKIVVVNPYREPGLDRYWVPSNADSLLFGTKIADAWVQVAQGGDVAFISAALLRLEELGALDESFIASKSVGWPALRAALAVQSIDEYLAMSGVNREELEAFCALYGSAASAVLVWSMGITQQACGSENVAAIVNLGLARGNIGRPGAGLMPIRGHSGVQGGAEMGAYATALPGGLPLEPRYTEPLAERYGFPIAPRNGRSAPQQLDAAERGEIDVLWSVGGNFLETMPDPQAIAATLSKVPLRVHQDIVVSSQMLIDPGEAVLLLPATTRYEVPGGGTETTTERRVAFSPEIPGPRIGEARPEWEVFVELAHVVDPARAHLVSYPRGTAQIREEIAVVVPSYAGIETLARSGDAIQWGGERLCEGQVFATDDGKAHFATVLPIEATLREGQLNLSTRRGKQFNSMVWKARDPLNGALRDDLLISAHDAAARGLVDGAAITVRSATGEVRARVKVAPIRAGNVQMHFPEANPLIDGAHRDPISHVPDYNAIVEIYPIA
jgi:molybdopterin-dependent oxidoreductase alpha subunit